MIRYLVPVWIVDEIVEKVLYVVLYAALSLVEGQETFKKAPKVDNQPQIFRFQLRVVEK